MTEIDLTIPPILDRRGETKKPLVLSYTMLNTYRNICPYQAKARFIDKKYPFVKTPQLEWGDTVHKAMELRIGGGKPLPQTMHQWEKFAAPFYAVKAKAEMKLGMTAGGHACDFFAKDVWLRGKADVMVVNGNVREDPLELEIQALLLNAKYPNLTSISGFYIWLAENRIGQKHDVSHTRDTFTYVQRIAADLEEDMRNGEFEQRRGGLCPYCPCDDCPNYGPKT